MKDFGSVFHLWLPKRKVKEESIMDNHLPMRSKRRPFGGQSSADVLVLWQQSWPKHTHSSGQVTALLHLALCQEAHGVKRGAEVAAVERGA